MVDTHTHLYFPEFNEDISQIMNLAGKEGVKHFILPNVDEASLPVMKDFHDRFPDITSMAIGLHPTEVNDDWERVLRSFEEEFAKEKYVAIGEVGIDLYWDKSMINAQKEVFEHQLRFAQETGVPVIIHSRDALEETLEVIEKVMPTVPLIFHSFTGNPGNVERIRQVCDPYFGINGVVTYKNAPELREALNTIGLNKILLETDSPYLSPVPKRGKRNDSSNLKFIRDKISEVIGILPEEVENTTDNNVSSIFKNA